MGDTPVISNGTPRMPASSLHFEPAQIDAIVAYLNPYPPLPRPLRPPRRAEDNGRQIVMNTAPRRLPRHAGHHRRGSRVGGRRACSRRRPGGTITSAAGEKLGGVTVSAKPAGGTVTTSVFTDEAGNYYFRRFRPASIAYRHEP